MVKVSIVQSAVNGNVGTSYVARPRDFPRRGPSHRCGNYENVIYNIILAYFSDCTLLYNQRALVYHVQVCNVRFFCVLDNVFLGACGVLRFHLRSGWGRDRGTSFGTDVRCDGPINCLHGVEARYRSHYANYR
jgi:hypothetical protein